MAEEIATLKTADAKGAKDEKDTARSNNEVALEMMKFIAVTTGYGKGATSAAGFSGKPSRTSEEYAESLIGLFERCRKVVSE
jgi:hypothetical protein